MLAVGLLSGGLDSTLAVKMVKDQGIEVLVIKFTSPFCQCDSSGCSHAAEQARRMGIELLTIPKGQDYLDIVRSPKYGYGSGMNPCIDCRIYMLREAERIAEERGAKFIFTGEVVGQRPMSQNRRVMDLVERESGLEGRLVRPLSAKLLPETEAERMGWIDREALLDISGRRRKVQIETAAELGVVDYPCPAGGCLLTSKEFAARLRDFLLKSPGSLTPRDVALLKVGRHFRVDGHKVIIGRNIDENGRLRQLAGSEHVVMEPVGVPGPVCLCEAIDRHHLKIASRLVCRYSDNGGREVSILVTTAEGSETLRSLPAAPEEIDLWRIGN
jgi:diphthamide synthase (EF-2-diphthine--ammonia ligase)